MMRSSGAISLFSELPSAPGRPSPFLASAALHVVLIGLGWLGLFREPRIVTPDGRYTVKLLNLDQPPPPVRPVANSASLTAPSFGRAGAAGEAKSNALEAPGSQSPPGADVTHQNSKSEVSGSAPEGRPAPASAPKLLAQQTTAPQTLLQPDLPSKLVQQVALLPKVVLWMPEATPVKLLTPPPPQEVAVARVQPSPARPNLAPDLADVRIAPSESSTKLPSLPPSTTSPIAVLGPSPLSQVPQTASRPAGPPTPAQLVSLSELELEKGTVALPGVSQVSPGSSASIVGHLPALSNGTGGTVASEESGRAAQGSGPGVHGDASGSTGTGSGHAHGSGGTNEGGLSGGSGAGEVAGGGSGAASGLQGAGNQGVPGSGMPDGLGVTRIQRPKDGQFGFVVVGGSVADQYPEIPNLWGRRLAYSVYLQVGLRKNWILQYALPKNPEAGTAATQPKAPWPYSIVRPHLAPEDWNADAIMVHGFVNSAGHFEKLAVIFPPEFTQTRFVINSLAQWQFRPAMENGQAAKVEILLVIPDPED